MHCFDIKSAIFILNLPYCFNNWVFRGLFKKNNFNLKVEYFHQFKFECTTNNNIVYLKQATMLKKNKFKRRPTEPNILPANGEGGKSTDD